MNPNYQQKSSGGLPAKTPVATSAPGSLAVICSTADAVSANDASIIGNHRPMVVSDSTAATLDIINDPGYVQGFETSAPIDTQSIVNALGEIFTKYEVPLGLLNKLLILMQYRLNFIIDDSGSMNEDTDVFMKEATRYITDNKSVHPNQKMTRWQEAENRLHVLIDIIAYIPTRGIKIVFLNYDEEEISLTQSGKSPDEFKQEAHTIISQTFARVEVKYKTPTYSALKKAFAEAEHYSDPTIHYLFTDGVPSDKTTEEVAQLIITRANPERNPLILITCTDDDEEAQWMKEVVFNCFVIFNVFILVIIVNAAFLF